MRHDELKDQIDNLIRQEDYDAAQRLLPDYVCAVTQQCLDPRGFKAARAFLKAACQTVKARRAHYLREITAMDCQRAYSGPRAPARVIDYTG